MIVKDSESDDSEPLSICSHSCSSEAKKVLDNVAAKSVKIELATTFGLLKLGVSMILNPEGKTPSDIQTEPVVLLLRKAVMRCLLLNREDDIYRNLTKLSERDDFLVRNTHKYEKQVRECVKEIREGLTKPLRLRKSFKNILKNAPADQIYL